MVKLLIEHGSNVSTTDADGNSPLHLASDWGDFYTIHTEQTQNQIDFIRICILGHDRVVQLLLENGSNASSTNTDGYTSLHWASRRGDKIESK